VRVDGHATDCRDLLLLVRLKFEKRLERRWVGELIDPGEQSSAGGHETSPDDHAATLLQAECRGERLTQVAVERYTVPQHQRDLVVVDVRLVHQEPPDVSPAKSDDVGRAGLDQPALVAPLPRALYQQADEVGHSTLTRL